MRWTSSIHPPCRLRCFYCETVGEFPHVKSYEHQGEELSLYACTLCASLIYDLSMVDAPVVASTDIMTPEAARAARYVLETGFSSHFVAMCGLSALPDVPESELGDYLFVDIGAGMGMASYFARTVVGLETVTVEPSYTGGLAAEILGLDVHRAYFEDLPPDVLDEVSRKRCLLHLNSVVEHLVDPAAVLADIVGRARVEVVAIIVPDGDALDFESPFSFALPFLAPRDHRHLPTRLGMEYLLRNLGFEFQTVRRSSNLLIAVGSRTPVALPSERSIRFAETLLLENMMRHPHPDIRSGGASRLLPGAVTRRDEPLLEVLRRRLPFEADSERQLGLLEMVAWDDLPFHLGQTSYWLGLDALGHGRADGALALLNLCVKFADAVAETQPGMALTPLEYKWEALLLRAHILGEQGEHDAARATLDGIVASRADPCNGARMVYVERAERALREMLVPEMA